MRTAKSRQPVHADDSVVGDTDEGFETYEIFRVDCPECGQSIALLAEEETLPEHALCPTPWNPFGLRVCAGSGRAASDAPLTGGAGSAHEEDATALLTLPAGLDWRRQPFSHVSGADSRPMARVGSASRG